MKKKILKVGLLSSILYFNLINIGYCDFYLSPEVGLSRGILKFTRDFNIQRDTIVNLEPIAAMFGVGVLDLLSGNFISYPYPPNDLPNDLLSLGQSPETTVRELEPNFDQTLFDATNDSNVTHTTLTRSLTRDTKLKRGYEEGFNLGYVIDDSKSFEFSYNNYNIHNKTHNAKAKLNSFIGTFHLYKEFTPAYKPYVGLGVGYGLVKAKYSEDGATIIDFKNHGSPILQFNLGNLSKLSDTTTLDIGYKCTMLKGITTQRQDPPFLYASYYDQIELMSAVRENVIIREKLNISPVHSLYLRFRFMF